MMNAMSSNKIFKAFGAALAIGIGSPADQVNVNNSISFGCSETANMPSMPGDSLGNFNSKWSVSSGVEGFRLRRNGDWGREVDFDEITKHANEVKNWNPHTATEEELESNKVQSRQCCELAVLAAAFVGILSLLIGCYFGVGLLQAIGIVCFIWVYGGLKSLDCELKVCNGE